MRRRRALGAAAALCLSLAGSGLLAPTAASASSDLTVQGVSAWQDTQADVVHVMGEVALSGTATSNYKVVMAQCTLVDSTGATLQSGPQPIEASILQPGEKAPFDALFFTGTGFTQPNCTASGATTTVVPDHNFSATITAVNTAEDGSQHVTGTVTNDNTVPESNISVILTSYDPSTGAVVDEGVAWVDGPVAGNGGQADFDLNSNLRPWDTDPSHSARMAEAPSPEVQLSTDNVSFGDQVKGTPSAEQQLYIRNIGTGDLHLDLPTFTGANPGDFTLGSDDQCTGTTLAQEATCSMGIIFVPQATGNRAATLQINDDANGSPNLVSLSGDGLARPSIGLSATSVEFGTQTAGTTGQTTVQLTSNGLDPLQISSIQVDDTADFGVDPGSCLNGAMAPGQGCQLTLRFHPASNGSLAGTVTIRSNARQDPATIALSGTGTSAIPGAQLSPAQLHFGTVQVSTASSAQTLTLSSTGTAPLAITQVAATGDFGETNNCPESLAAGSSCTITVTFTPTAAGTRTGSVTVTDNAGSGSQTTALDGVGTTETDFYFAEGFTGPGFVERLRLLMPNHSGTATIDYFMPGGAHVQKAQPMTEGKVADVDVNAAVGANQEVSVKVTLPFPGVAERVMHFKLGSWYGSTDIVGVSQPATEWDFAEGSTLGFFSEYLTLQNPNPASVAVTLNYLTNDPSIHPSKTLMLAGSSRTTIPVFMGNTNGGSCDAASTCGVGPNFAGVSLRVIAGLPIIAERPFYVNGFSFGSGAIRDGHVAFGANAAALTWNFAEGTTLPGFNEYLTIENPQTGAAHVTLNYLIQGTSTPVVKPLTVAPLSRSTVEVFKTDQGVGPNAAGVSVQVTSSDQAIVVERPMYIVHNFGSGAVAGATDVVGSTSLAKLFGFATSSTLSGENDFLTIQNPGSAKANVRIIYYTQSGTVERDVAVDPNTRSTIPMFGAAASGGVGSVTDMIGIVISSDQPVLVEKPTYSSIASSFGATDTLGFSPPNF